MSALKNFLNTDGQLKVFPAKRKMKIEALFYLAEKFEDGKQYAEKEVNDLLNQWHTFGDPATLRRELYDYHFIDRSRDGSCYWLENPQPSHEQA
jgi:hypothetical protein